MAWITIEPQRGRPLLPAESVTIAGGMSGRQRTMPHIRLQISEGLIKRLTWTPRMKVRVDHDPMLGRLRLAPAGKGQTGFSLAPCPHGGALRLTFSLPGQPNEKHAAQAVSRHEVVGGTSLVLSLPSWACQVARVAPPMSHEGGMRAVPAE